VLVQHAVADEAHLVHREQRHLVGTGQTIMQGG
jgi:hypothetical protein